MNWKAIAMTAAKQAVNAALVTLAPMFSAPDQFNWHTVAGVQHMASLVGGAILAREALVWGPKLLAWSQSPDEQTVLDIKNPVTGEVQKTVVTVQK